MDRVCVKTLGTPQDDNPTGLRVKEWTSHHLFLPSSSDRNAKKYAGHKMRMLGLIKHNAQSQYIIA